MWYAESTSEEGELKHAVRDAVLTAGPIRGLAYYQKVDLLEARGYVRWQELSLYGKTWPRFYVEIDTSDESVSVTQRGQDGEFPEDPDAMVVPGAKAICLFSDRAKQWPASWKGAIVKAAREALKEFTLAPIPMSST